MGKTLYLPLVAIAGLAALAIASIFASSEGTTSDELAPVESSNPVATITHAPDAIDGPRISTATPEREPQERIRPMPHLPDTISGVCQTTAGTRIGGVKVRLEVVDLDAVLAGPRGRAHFDLGREEKPGTTDVPPPLPAPVLATLETIADELGAFEFRELPRAAASIFVLHRDRLSLSKDGFATTLVWPNQRAPIVVTMKRRAPLRGVCRDDASNEPIALADLQITRPGAAQPDGHVLTTHTDERGNFTTPQPVEEGHYHFKIVRTGHAPLSIERPTNFDSLELEFPNYPTYVLRVSDATTQLPLSGVSVWTGPQLERFHRPQRKRFRPHDLMWDPDMFGELSLLGATDGGGELRIEDLEPMSFLALSLDSFLTTVVKVPATSVHDADRQIVPVELEGVAFVRGRVTDWNGQPMPGVWIGEVASLERFAAGFHYEPMGIETDEDGRFRYPVTPDSARTIQLGAIDREAKYLVGRFPAAECKAPGDATDVGTVALVLSARPVPRETEAEDDDFRFARFTARTRQGTPLLEIQRRSKEGTEDEFLGFVVVDTRHEAVIEVSVFTDQVVTATCFDGFAAYPRGEVQGFDWPRPRVFGGNSFPKISAVEIAAPVDGAGAGGAYEIRVRWKSWSESIPYPFVGPVEVDNAGRLTLFLPEFDEPATIEGRPAHSAGPFSILCNLAPQFERTKGR